MGVYSRTTVPRPCLPRDYDFASVPLTVPDRPTVPAIANRGRMTERCGKRWKHVEEGEMDKKRGARTRTGLRAALRPASENEDDWETKPRKIAKRGSEGKFVLKVVG